MYEVKIRFLLENITRDMTFYEVCRGNHLLMRRLWHSKSNLRTLMAFLERFSARKNVLSLEGKYSIYLNPTLEVGLSDFRIFHRELESPVQGLEPIYNCHVVW